jgi:signal transduction histidine kinase
MAAAMENMNTIGYIFSGARHEIGNPVNAVRLLLSLIKKKLQDIDKTALENYLDRLFAEISKIEYLLNSFRNVNMYERPEIRSVSIREFLEKLMPLVKEDFGNKGIEITVRIEPGVDVIAADPRALQQVLLNIFANAADALASKNNPTISVSVIQAECGACIQIEDNGQGMTEEEQRNLFKPFYTTKTHGTGLGMVIVKKMLTRMNSTIEIKSRKNAGTMVEIMLPAPTVM